LVLLKARIGAPLERTRLHDQEVEHFAAIQRQGRRADELLGAIPPASAVRELKANDRVVHRRFQSGQPGPASGVLWPASRRFTCERRCLASGRRSGARQPARPGRLKGKGVVKVVRCEVLEV
jgi:hypothetical protein